jgi:microtubule-associated protein-like 6
MKLRDRIGRTLLTAGGDGVVREWNLIWDAPDKPEVEPSTNGPWDLTPGNPDKPTIIALDCMENSETFVAGDDRNDIWEVDEDPKVMIEGQSGDVTGLAPHPLRPNLYCTACGDGSVYVWDSFLKKNLRAFEIKRGIDGNGQPGGSGKGLRKGELLRPKVCCFSNQGDLFAIGTGGDHGGVVGEFEPQHPDRGGVVQVFAVTPKMFENDEFEQDEWEPQKIWECHHAKEGIEAIRFSPNGRLLAAADRENYINIYDVADNFRRVGRCSGHSSAVLQIDWSTDGTVLMSNSMDREALFWDIRGRPAVDQSQRDQQWDSWTCQLGFPVMGIWSDNMDGTDINAVHRSTRGGHIVAADDNGQVRLMNYPCVIDKAPAGVFGGHCSHVPNVRWLSDDRRVVSAGGHDRTLFQWRIVGDDDTPPDYGAVGGRGNKAQMAAAREKNARKGRHDEDETARQQRLAHEREVEVVGASKDLRVELRVRELKKTIEQQEADLRAKQDEIQALQLMLFEQEQKGSA